MINKKILQDDRRNKLNFLINKYNFYLQEALHDYIKNKQNIMKTLKTENISEKDITYFKGVCDTCKEIMEIMRREK